MDYNPPDNIEMPTPMIQLKSSDGLIFEVEVKAAKLSSYIKEMLDDLGVEEIEVIPVPQNAPEISGAILGKIIQWANHHKDDPPAAENDEKKVKPTDDISSWDAEFLQVVDLSTLFQIIRAADYLSIRGLLDLTCKTVANMIKGMCPSEIRQRSKIQDDFIVPEVYEDFVWCERLDYEENDHRSGNGTVRGQTSAAFIQNMNQEDDQVVQDCFRNSVILRKLFEYFSTRELLYSHQLVNKLWNYEARIVIRQRGNVYGRLSCGCTGQYDDDFESFGNHLQQMNFIPYSGISIETRPKAHTGLPAALDPTHEAILDRLPLRHISVKLGGDWQNHKNCPTLLLLKKIFQDYGGVVEELEVDIFKREEFNDHFLRDCSFPGLKVLKLKENGSCYTMWSMDYTTYTMTLVSHAPNLQELHTTGRVSLFENVLEGREALLVYAHQVEAPFGHISKRVIHGLRLKRMELKYPGFDFDFGRFNRITPMLLQASSTTLCFMNIDAVLAVSLMCYGIPLQNLKYLTMYINYSQLERVCPQILRIVKNFDFSRLLPNVKKVDIWHTNTIRESRLSVDHLNTIIEQADAVLKEPAPNRAANVKKLRILFWNLTDTAALYYAEFLPNIEKLYVKAFAEQPIPFGFIWKNWGNLTGLEVEGNILPNDRNLDSVFCGIFPEEMAELRQKDEAYLKAVNIVPVMPAMTGLKNLKTLKLIYEGRRDEHFVDDGAFMFSKATALLAFAKFPELAVSLSITSYVRPPVTNLKPYMSIKSYIKDPRD